MNATQTLPGATVAAAALGTATALADPVVDLVSKIKSPDDHVRGPAWQGSASAGAAAVKPLAAVMSDPDFEIARAAKRAMWLIVRHAGRPGAAGERKAVQVELLALLQDPSMLVRQAALWMLSEIGDAEAVAPMATLLANAELREDARCALLHLPGPEVTAAFKQALATAPEDFRFALADSLRDRGEAVKGHPSKRLVPVKQTAVTGKPAGKPAGS